MFVLTTLICFFESCVTKTCVNYRYDFISSMISEDYQKVLKNIKKFEERKKRKRNDEQLDDDDEDSESGIESDRKSRYVWRVNVSILKGKLLTHCCGF